jgi:hypothetical protein
MNVQGVEARKHAATASADARSHERVHSRGVTCGAHAVLWLQVTKSIKFEKEFLCDHDLFLALNDIIPECAEIRLDMKRGEHHSEFSMFRYDVLFWRADAKHPREVRSSAHAIARRVKDVDCFAGLSAAAAFQALHRRVKLTRVD